MTFIISTTLLVGPNGDGQIFKTNGEDKPWTLQFNAGQYLRSVEFIDDTNGLAGLFECWFLYDYQRWQILNKIDIVNSFGTICGFCGISHFGDAIIAVRLCTTAYAHIIKLIQIVAKHGPIRIWAVTSWSPFGWVVKLMPGTNQPTLFFISGTTKWQ